MSLIKFAVKSLVTDEKNRIVKARLVNRMDSTTERVHTNDVPHIMAALSHVHPTSRNNRFTYTFPFRLA